MLKEFLVLFTVGAFVGGTMIRIMYRFYIGANLANITVNLSQAKNRKFRLIELLPFLGTYLTHIKHEDKNTNCASLVFGCELFLGLMTFLSIKLTDSVVSNLFLLLFALIFVFILIGETVDKETKSTKVQEEPIRTTRRTRVNLTLDRN